MIEKFSVCQWFDDGQYDYELRYVPLERAVTRAMGIAHSVGGRLGTTVRVIITDGDDSIVWEWKHGEGIVFPPELKGAH